MVVAIRAASVIPTKMASNSYMQPQPEQLASSSSASSPLPPSSLSPSSAIACYCQPLVATSSMMVTRVINVATDNFVVAVTAIVVVAIVISVAATINPGVWSRLEALKSGHGVHDKFQAGSRPDLATLVLLRPAVQVAERPIKMHQTARLALCRTTPFSAITSLLASRTWRLLCATPCTI